MSQYPFTHIEHCVYNNTLLEETQVAFVFSKEGERVSVPASAQEGVSMFFKRFFNLDHSLDEYLSKESITVSNKELGIGYEFGTKYTLLRFSRKKYHSFLESVPQYLVPMKWFVFKTLDKKKVLNLLVRKTNVLPFRIDNLEVFKQHPEIVLETVFKKHFLDLPVVKKESGVPGALLEVVDREFRFGGRHLLLRTGFAVPKDGDDRYFLIFDMALQNDGDKSTEEGSIDTTLLEMNDVLFDAFHWCMSDKMIDMMKGGSKPNE